MAKSLYVTCSFCKGLMEVDAVTGEVLQKWPVDDADTSIHEGRRNRPAEKAPSDGGDKMSAALKKLEDAKRKRLGLFDQTKGELEGQKKKSEDAFTKEVERIKKEGIKENPIRPFDLD